ncbi:hypothetical protein BFJ63_vAg16598 [Fusarium oxysporum f. sp. narcissi]|uniref:Uncharacterized protein n=1 Tax=Fusarium oxysporum f. sp. narcissi TaxID=451672 RepID=A0A4Q2V967_FUSOX|nr:hypothetical protein BFJ63_vAg16598 [Fusarium oxysporum f. sp. narcissi]
MDTDKPLHDLFHILGFFFISVAKIQHPAIRSYVEISDACKIIAQDVPEAVRNKLHRLGTEVQAEFRKVPYEQISPDHSCPPDTTTATIVQHGSPNGPDEQQVEHDSPTRTFQPSKQTLAAGAEFSRSQSSRKEKSPREGSSTGTKCSPEDNEQPFLIADLKSWAQSPKPFLSSGTISIDDLAVFDYIQALEKSSQMTKIARRFALLQLWVSKEVWRPLPPQEFKKRLGTASGAKFNRWLREGRTLFLLKAHIALSAELKADLHTNAEPNINKESYNNIELLLQSQHTEEAKKIVSCFDVKELELPRSCEDCVTNSKLYRDAASSISKYLEELHIKRLFGDQTQLRHRLEVRENDRPAKRRRRSYEIPRESPSNLIVIPYRFDRGPMHSGNRGLPYAMESTTDAGSDGGHEVRSTSTDMGITVSGSHEGAGSQSGALVMPGSNSSLIVTPPLTATAGGYETQPSTETTPVRNIEAGMGPTQGYSSTGHHNTSTNQLSGGHLDRPCADRVEELHDCHDNISQFSSVCFGIYEAPSQASLPSLNDPQFASCQLHNLPDSGVLLSDPATSCSNEVIGHVKNISGTLAMDTGDRFNPDCPSNFDDILCNSSTFDFGTLLAFPT